MSARLRCSCDRSPHGRRPSPSPRLRGEGRGEGQRQSLRSHPITAAGRGVHWSKRLPLAHHARLPLTLALSPFRSAARGEGIGWRIGEVGAPQRTGVDPRLRGDDVGGRRTRTATSTPSCPRRRASTQASGEANQTNARRHSPSPRLRGEGRGEGQRQSLRSHPITAAGRGLHWSKRRTLTHHARRPLTLALSPFRSTARGEGIVWCVGDGGGRHD